jgi:hypothetical protein
MMARNHTIRFMDNNLAIRTPNDFSSEDATYPLSNTRDNRRAKIWKPTGYFLIDATNRTLYVNDGVNVEIPITEGEYATPALLATEIQTRLNALSTGWTVTYSSTTFKFTIAHSGSATLRLSVTTSAIWSVIGYTTSADIVGTSWTADQQRNHMYEYIIWDLGAPRDVTFFAAIGPIGQDFSISDAATVKLQGNNINDFTSPPFDETLTRTEEGIFGFFDGESDYAYRFYRLLITDIYNTLGPSGNQISYIYLGDYLTFDNDRTVSHGYDKGQNDPSLSTESENGTTFFDTKTKHSTFNGLGLELLKRDHKDALASMFKIFGKTTPFFISIDPINLYTDNLEELTKFVYFSEEPRFRHVIKDLFSVAVSFKEVV